MGRDEGGRVGGTEESKDAQKIQNIGTRSNEITTQTASRGEKGLRGRTIAALGTTATTLGGRKVDAGRKQLVVGPSHNCFCTTCPHHISRFSMEMFLVLELTSSKTPRALKGHSVTMLEPYRALRSLSKAAKTAMSELLTRTYEGEDPQTFLSTEQTHEEMPQHQGGHATTVCLRVHKSFAAKETGRRTCCYLTSTTSLDDLRWTEARGVPLNGAVQSRRNRC